MCVLLSTTSFDQIDEPCWQSCAARGRPRLSYRENHRSAPVKLTAAQSGPWYQGDPEETNELNSTEKRQPLKERMVKSERKAEQKDGLYGHQAKRLSLVTLVGHKNVTRMLCQCLSSQYLN